MSTLTKEWLHQTIAELEEERDATPGAVSEDAAKALAAMKLALASLEAEASGRNPVLAYADSYRDMAKRGVEYIPVWSVITDLERNIAPLFTAQPAPLVDADDNFYSWFGREWHEHYQQNQYTTAAKQMLGVMAESAWKAGRRAAMLQGAENSESRCAIQTAPALDSSPKNAESRCGESPVIPDDWVACSELMPEDNQEVITYNIFGYRHVSFFDEHSGHFFDRLDGSPVDCVEHVLVSHWMPLPAAPQHK